MLDHHGLADPHLTGRHLHLGTVADDGGGVGGQGHQLGPGARRSCRRDPLVGLGEREPAIPGRLVESADRSVTLIVAQIPDPRAS